MKSTICLNVTARTALIHIITWAGFLLPVCRAASLTLAWDESRSAVAGYKLHYGNSSRHYTQTINAGKVIQYRFENLPPGTFYFAVTAYDNLGNESDFSNEASTVIPAADTAPPLLSNILASNVTHAAATISWLSNEDSDTQIDYGPSTQYGSQTVLAAAKTTIHSQYLSGLLPGTVYHYRVRSKDASGNQTISSDNAFTTAVLQGEINPPVSSGETATGGSAESTPQQQENPADSTTDSAETGPVTTNHNPAADIQLEQTSYMPGDTVRIRSLWISNPASQSINVELKAWLSLQSLPPMPLTIPDLPEALSLDSGFVKDFGTIPVFMISGASPSGSGIIGSRLLNPITGETLFEDLNPFSIASPANGTDPTQDPPASMPQIQMKQSYLRSRTGYTIANNGNQSADIEVKVWSEDINGLATPVYTIMTGKTLTLPAGGSILVYPKSSAPNMRARVLDAATGTVLSEQ